MTNTVREFRARIKSVIPTADMQTDNDSQFVIYTNRRMRKDSKAAGVLYERVRAVLPTADMQTDNDGRIIIYTGLTSTDGVHVRAMRGARSAARGLRGFSGGVGRKPFVAKKTKSGWKLYLYLDVMRHYAQHASMVDAFIKKLHAAYPGQNFPSEDPRTERVAVNLEQYTTHGKKGYTTSVVPEERAKNISSKERVISSAHYLGRYHFGLGDFVDSYITYER